MIPLRNNNIALPPPSWPLFLDDHRASWRRSFACKYTPAKHVNSFFSFQSASSSSPRKAKGIPMRFCCNLCCCLWLLLCALLQSNSDEWSKIEEGGPLPTRLLLKVVRLPAKQFDDYNGRILGVIISITLSFPGCPSIWNWQVLPVCVASYPHTIHPVPKIP